MLDPRCDRGAVTVTGNIAAAAGIACIVDKRHSRPGGNVVSAVVMQRWIGYRFPVCGNRKVTILAAERSMISQMTVGLRIVVGIGRRIAVTMFAVSSPVTGSPTV